MTKRGVRIAYRSKIVKIEVKNGRVRLLLGISKPMYAYRTSCTQAKTHVCRTLRIGLRIQKQGCIHMNLSYVRWPEPMHAEAQT